MGIFLPSVEGSTECGGTIPRGASPAGWSRHTRLIPTHEVGITHTLEHGRKYWHYFEKSSAKRPLAPWGGCHLYGSVYAFLPRGECLYGSRIDTCPTGAAAKLRSSAAAAPYTSTIPRILSYESWMSQRRRIILISNGSYAPLSLP